MLEDGADILDVGGESTRPGAEPLDAEEELRRVLPVVEAFAGRAGRLDRYLQGCRRARSRRARRRHHQRHQRFRYDPVLGGVAAESGAAVVLMHNRGRSRDMYNEAVYDDVAGEIAAELSVAIAAAENAGIRREAIILDPGLGFAKKARHSYRGAGLARAADQRWAGPCSAVRHESRF